MFKQICESLWQVRTPMVSNGGPKHMRMAGHHRPKACAMITGHFVFVLKHYDPGILPDVHLFDPECCNSPCPMVPANSPSFSSAAIVEDCLDSVSPAWRFVRPRFATTMSCCRSSHDRSSGVLSAKWRRKECTLCYAAHNSTHRYVLCLIDFFSSVGAQPWRNSRVATTHKLTMPWHTSFDSRVHTTRFLLSSCTGCCWDVWPSQTWWTSVLCSRTSTCTFMTSWCNLKCTKLHCQYSLRL